MDSTLYVGLAHQNALQQRMDIIANNIANMNTTAYQREAITFQDQIMELEGGGNTGLGSKMSFPLAFGVSRTFRDGSLFPTNNPLDMAITGQGFLTVETAEGEVRYTRNGHMQLNENGEIVNSAGDRLLDEDGDAIELPPDITDFTITDDGSIVTDLGPLQRIQLVTFDNLDTLKKVGNSLYETEAEAIPAEDAKLTQGMLEASNVNGVEEITALIQTSRAYQAMSSLINDFEQLQSQAIRRLGSVNA